MDSRKLVDFLLESRNCPEIWDSGERIFVLLSKAQECHYASGFGGGCPVPKTNDTLHFLLICEISLSVFRSLLKWCDACSKCWSLFLNMERNFPHTNFLPVFSCGIFRHLTRLDSFLNVIQLYIWMFCLSLIFVSPAVQVEEQICWLTILAALSHCIDGRLKSFFIWSGCFDFVDAKVLKKAGYNFRV